MNSKKLYTLVGAITLAASATIIGFTPYLRNYIEIERPHQKRIQIFESSQTPDEFNDNLKNLVTSKEFNLYFKNNEPSKVYKRFSIFGAKKRNYLDDEVLADLFRDSGEKRKPKIKLDLENRIVFGMVKVLLEQKQELEK